MNRKDLYNGFNEVDDDILERSERATVSNVVSIRRRWPVALIAAILCLFLMGAGVVAVIYGDSIQSWFGHYFGLVTGQEMSEGQTALIDHLSQDISQSKTVGETTVTVDSATVGDDNFFILLRVEGLELSNRYNYGFDDISMEVTPDPVDQGEGMEGYGFQGLGMDGDGAALFMLDHSYVSRQGFVWDDSPLEVKLCFKDFSRGPSKDDGKILQEGEWTFTITLDRGEQPHSIALPDTKVFLYDSKSREDVEVLLTEIELTNTGLRFQYNADGRTYSVPAFLDVILQNGAEVNNSGGRGAPLEDGETMSYSFQWVVPVCLDEVQAVRIGSVDIPVE